MFLPMFSPSRFALAAVLCSPFIFGGVVVSAQAALGEDFRVENKVFVGNQKEPASQSTTIFHDGVVYDYLDKPAEVVIFDGAAEQFVLLDIVRRVRAEVTTDQVEQLTRQLQQLASTQADPFIRFSATPKFDEQFDQPANELTLSSPWMTYRMLLVDAGSRAIAEQYREFADWYARLNTVLSPGSKPPAARLLVNAALAKREATAREVYLTLTPKKGLLPKRITIHSRHRLVRQVVQADLDRIKQTREFTKIFHPVGFEQYRKYYNAKFN